jgi:hypothetical protein
MAYEVFIRTGVRVEEPTLSLVPGGRLALNAAACRLLVAAGVRHVLLLWDSTNNKLALKAAPKADKNAYAVSIVADKHAGSLRAKSFLDHIGWNASRREMLSAVWNKEQKMLEVTVPTKLLSSEGRNAKTMGGLQEAEHVPGRRVVRD